MTKLPRRPINSFINSQNSYEVQPFIRKYTFLASKTDKYTIITQHHLWGQNYYAPLCRSCGIKHHTPRDLGKVLPTMHWIAGTLTTVPAVELAIAHKLAPAPSSQPHLGAPGKHCLR